LYIERSEKNFIMSDRLFNLSGKCVLVTGGGTGIGKGVAIELAKSGADVAIGYNSSVKGAEEVVNEIRTMGRRAVAIKANLYEFDSCIKLVDSAVEYLGGLDALINNAGITFTKKFLEITEEEFNYILSVNFKSQYFICQRAISYMINRGEDLKKNNPGYNWPGGSIINVSSVHGIVGLPRHSLYAATKGAIISFSRELAVELCPKHIRVNIVAPGTIEVPSYYKADPNYTREVGNKIVPWGRVGLPNDVGYLIVYLVSDESEFMTGSVICFDGGLTAKMPLNYEPPEKSR